MNPSAPHSAPRTRGCPRGAVSVLLLLAALSPGAGCSTVPLTTEARREIASVAVKDIVLESAEFSGSSPEMDLPTRSAIWYSFWITFPVGAVLDVIDWRTNSQRRVALFEYKLKQASVDVPAMTQASFTSRLGRAGVFPSVIPSGGEADAEFELRLEHGLTDHLGLSEAWHPWVELTGTLRRRATGEVLWQQTESIGSSDKRVPGVQYPFRRHDLLRNSYQQAVDAVAEALVKSLEG